MRLPPEAREVERTGLVELSAASRASRSRSRASPTGCCHARQGADELVRRGNSGAQDLDTLAALVAAGELVPQISALQALVDRALVGKAVLDFDVHVH